MSPSPPSPQALYHAIPQSPDLSLPDEVNLDAEGEGNPLKPSPEIAQVQVDGRTRWIFFILGCSVLLPWNVMITATPYFLSRLAGSSYRSTFSSYLSTSFTLANFAFLAHATATSKNSIPSRRTRITILSLSVLTFLLTLSTFFTPTPGLFFTFVLLNGAAQATAGAYLSAAIVAVASLFGPLAVQSMMSGQAAVAVAVSGVQVLSAAASVWGKPQTYVSDGSAEERSAFIFFGLSTLFLLASAFAHAWLVQTPVYRIVAAPLEQPEKAKAIPSIIEHSLMSSGRAEFSDAKANALRVAKVNIIFEIAVAYVFMVTLAVFPPITTSIQPTNPNTHPLLFSAIHFLVFNIGDLLGRYICSFPRFLVWSSKNLLVQSMARTLFIPLFLMCNVQRPTTTVAFSPIIGSDSLFMIILFIFGWSNGYVSSLCMMAAPSIQHNPKLRGRVEDVDVAATVASFCLVGGLVLGSIASFAVKSAICGCNPFLE